MAQPVIQNLSDIVAQIGAAYKPQQDLIDQSITANDTAGTAQTAGLDAKKTNAFSGIEQSATNKGMAFSGFTPDAQAKYTGSTYLPALANLQSTIASTRNNLMGKKAVLTTQGNTEAYNLHNSQVSDAQKWQDAQDAAARAERQRQEQNAFTANQNSLSRAASAVRASAKAAAVNPAKGYGMSKSPTTGGLSFHGPNGAPVTMAQYASTTGADMKNLLATSGDAGDANILKDINANMSNEALLQKYPWVFGG